jgi:TIR domain
MRLSNGINSIHFACLDDKPVARRIVNKLKKHGVASWIDEAEIRVGESIPAKVADGLAASNALCLLFSKAAAKSNWVMREFNAFLHMAMEDGRPIIPCRLDKTTKMPELIRDIKYADFSKSFGVGMNAVLAAVNIVDEVAHQKEIAARKAILKCVIARLPALASEKVLQIIHDCQFKTGSFTPEEDTVVNALGGECEEDDTFDIDFDHAGRLYIPNPMQEALEQLMGA